jgi:hypothetical protein
MRREKAEYEGRHVSKYSSTWEWKIRDKLQGKFDIELLRVHGSETNGASNSELGRESIRAKIVG